MATITANGSSRLSTQERATILALLEEYTNVLAVYRNTLKKPLGDDNRIPVDCILSDSEYVCNDIANTGFTRCNLASLSTTSLLTVSDAFLEPICETEMEET